MWWPSTTSLIGRASCMSGWVDAQQCPIPLPSCLGTTKFHMIPCEGSGRSCGSAWLEVLHEDHWHGMVSHWTSYHVHCSCWTSRKPFSWCLLVCLLHCQFFSVTVSIGLLKTSSPCLLSAKDQLMPIRTWKKTESVISSWGLGLESDALHVCKELLLEL